jgi:hypothetical protein
MGDVRAGDLSSRTALLVVTILAGLAGCSGTKGLEGATDADAQADPLFDAPEDHADAGLDPDAVDVPSETDAGLGPHWILQSEAGTSAYTSAMVGLDDGSVLVAGGFGFGDDSDDLWLFHVDTGGMVSGQKVLADVSAALHSMIRLGDGSLLLVGTTDAAGAGGWDIWLVKMIPTGEIVWEKTLGGAGDDTYPAVLETHEGRLLVAARTTSFSPDDDLWLVKLDSDANVLWQYGMGGPGDEEFLGGRRIAEDEGGRLFVISHTASFGVAETGAWIVSLDPEGLILWQQVMGGTNSDMAEAMLSTGDGIIFVGHTRSSPSFIVNSAWAVEMESGGEIMWQRAYNSRGGIDLATWIEPRGDGGYIVAGGVNEEYAIYEFRMWIASMNTNGTFEWSREIVDPDYSIAVAGMRHGGALYAIGVHGERAYMEPGAAIVARLALDGSIPVGCSIVRDVDMELGYTSLVPRTTDVIARATDGVVSDVHTIQTDADVSFEVLCPE